jgi:3-polyprenyl-4-hydroxybenzoate decarboxylase
MGKKAIVAIVVVIIAIVALYVLSNISYGHIQLVSSDAKTLEASKLQLTATLKNTSEQWMYNVNVTFATEWSSGSDIEMKAVLIPSGESRTVSAILDANPLGDTEYEITWEWEQYTWAK